MAKRLTKDEWIAARIAWENDPIMTGAQLAEAVGISRQSVNERMKRDARDGDPWEKKVTRAEIAERAMAEADKRQRAVPVKPLTDDAQTEEIDPVASAGDEAKPDKAVRNPDSSPVSLTVPDNKRIEQAGTQFTDPVQARADVIERHRREWSVARGLVGEAVKSRDFDRAKLAKITSETLNIIQKSERTAWGLDALDPAEKPVVVIERG